MAKVQVNIDTEQKTMEITIDGAVIADATEFSASCYPGDPPSVYSSIYTQTSEVNGVRKQVSYYASGSKEAEILLSSQAEVLLDKPGFVGVEESHSVLLDISKFFDKL
jgi:hypothetical protein